MARVESRGLRWRLWLRIATRGFFPMRQVPSFATNCGELGPTTFEEHREPFYYCS